MSLNHSDAKPCIRLLPKSRGKALQERFNRSCDLPAIVNHSAHNSPEGSPRKNDEIPRESVTSEGWGVEGGERLSVPLNLLPSSAIQSPDSKVEGSANGSTPRAVSWDRIREAMRTECPSPEDEAPVDKTATESPEILQGGAALNFEDSDEDVEERKQEVATTLFFGSDEENSPTAYHGVDERSFQEDTWLHRQGPSGFDTHGKDSESDDEYSKSDPLFDPVKRTQVYLIPTQGQQEKSSFPQRLFETSQLTSPKRPQSQMQSPKHQGVVAASLPRMASGNSRTPSANLDEVKELKATLVASLYRRTDRETSEIQIQGGPELEQEMLTSPAELEHRFLGVDVKVEQDQEKLVTVKLEAEAKAEEQFAYGPMRFTCIEKEGFDDDASQWPSQLRHGEPQGKSEELTEAAADSDVKQVFGNSVLSYTDKKSPRHHTIEKLSEVPRPEVARNKRKAPLMAPVETPDRVQETGDDLASFFVSGVEGELKLKELGRKRASEAFASCLGELNQNVHHESSMVVGNWTSDRKPQRKRMTPLLPPTKD